MGCRDPAGTPRPVDPAPLEPMLPALAETVLFWSAGQRQVLVIHDEQSALTASRLRRLQQVLADGADSSAADGQDTEALPAGVSPLAGLVTIDSRDDPRVQVADLLAGVARRAPGLDGDGLLQPFLSPTSLRVSTRQRMLPALRPLPAAAPTDVSTGAATVQQTV